MGEPSQESAPAESTTVLEALLEYQFKDEKLLLRALTHRSFVNEHEGEDLRHNESMEFLGDAVLGFLISSRVFYRYPNLSEGALSKIKAYLVSAANLVHLADRVRLGNFFGSAAGKRRREGAKRRRFLSMLTKRSSERSILTAELKRPRTLLTARSASFLTSWISRSLPMATSNPLCRSISTMLVLLSLFTASSMRSARITRKSSWSRFYSTTVSSRKLREEPRRKPSKRRPGWRSRD